MYIVMITAFITAATMVYFTCQKLIQIAFEKHLFDEPVESRKIHVTKTPSLGGAAIVIVFMIVSLLFQDNIVLGKLKHLFIASLFLLSVGIVDDLIGMKALNKLFYQIAIALFTTWIGGIRIEHLGGFLGIYEMDLVYQILLTTFLMVFVINAINLIDGIDCLAGSIALLISVMLFYQFLNTQQWWLMLTTSILAGSLIGFLLQNKTPSKIFMGDTGSMFLGYTLSVLSVYYLNGHKTTFTLPISPLLICVSFFIVPVYDTMRVFILRIINRTSPFSADRNHIHHRLLDAGFTHMQSTGILLLFTILSVSIITLFQQQNSVVGLLMLISICLVCDYLLKQYSHRKSQKNLHYIEFLNSKPAKNAKVKYILKNNSDTKSMMKNLPLN